MVGFPNSSHICEAQGYSGVKYNHSVINVALPAPTGIEPVKVTSKIIEVKWDHLEGATKYLISCDNGNKYEPVDGGTTTEHTFSSLEQNTSYSIIVRGCASCGTKSDPSVAKEIKTGKHCVTIMISLHANG